jgi:hypothetical protein
LYVPGFSLEWPAVNLVIDALENIFHAGVKRMKRGGESVNLHGAWTFPPAFGRESGMPL